MTSSCGHSWLGPRRGPLQLVMVYLGPWPALFGWKDPRDMHGRPTWLEVFLAISCQSSIFAKKKRHFWSRIDDYPRFFVIFLTSDEPDSCKAGPSLEKPRLRSILVAGRSFHVIESTSFSSPTAPQRPQRPPGDPPGPPRRV